MNRSRRNLTAFTVNLSAMTLWSLAGINYLIYSCLQDAYAFWRAASAKEKGKLDTRREIYSAWIRPGGYERREPTRTHRWGERFEGVIDDKDDVYTAQFALCPPSPAVSAIFFIFDHQTDVDCRRDRDSLLSRSDEHTDIDEQPPTHRIHRHTRRHMCVHAYMNMPPRRIRRAIYSRSRARRLPSRSELSRVQQLRAAWI